MANPLSNEDSLYRRIKYERIRLVPEVWAFIENTIGVDLLSIDAICRYYYDRGQPMPGQEAEEVLFLTRDIKKSSEFLILGRIKDLPYYKENHFSVHPVIQELFSHQIGNDVCAVNFIIGNSVDRLEPTPIAVNTLEKIINRLGMVKEFIFKLKEATCPDYQLTAALESHIEHDTLRACVRCDHQGNISFASKQFSDLLSMSTEELRMVNLRDITPQKWLKSEGWIGENQLAQRSYSDTYKKEFIRKDGSVLPVFINARRAKVNNSLQTWFLVRSRVFFEEAGSLGEDPVWLKNVLERMEEGVTVSDTSGRFYIFNDKMAEITGFSAEEVNARGDLLSLICAGLEEKEKSLKRMAMIIESGQASETEANIRTKTGERKTLLVSTSLIYRGGNKVFISVYRDITKAKILEKEHEKLNEGMITANKKLKQLVMVDSHTGLFNHSYLKEAIRSVYSQSLRTGAPFSVIMSDIDCFKAINDVHGHIFGDLVLRQFSAEFKKALRAYDIVIRYGGEEFVVISPNTNMDEAVILSNRVLRNISVKNFGNKKNLVRLKLSMAVASYPEDASVRAMGLVGFADKILNLVKLNGGNRVYSSRDLDKDNDKDADASGIMAITKKIEKLNKRCLESLSEAIFSFAKAVKLKEDYPPEEAEDMVSMAIELARSLGLAENQVELVKHASMAHDLGKISISEKILKKPAPLDKEEFRKIKMHPVTGANIIKQIQSWRPVLPLLLYHHERWDGKGYPVGIKNKQIPFGARIIGLCDCYVALISDRPYRKAYSKKEAGNIIKKYSGIRFDPKITGVFLDDIGNK